MRLIKLALISFVFLFAVVTAFSLFIPSRIRISKAINLHESRQSVLALVKDTATWHRWHPVFMQPDSLRNFLPIAIHPKASTDSSFVVDMVQEGKRPVTSGWEVYGHEGVDSVTLQWYLDFKLKWYPWQKFGSLFYENTYGVMMEQGLDRIKEIADAPDRL